MAKSKIKISNGNKGLWTFYFYDEYRTYEEADLMGTSIKEAFKKKGVNIKTFIINEGKIYPVYYLYLSKNFGGSNE